MPHKPRSRPSAASRWAIVRAPGITSTAAKHPIDQARSIIMGPNPYPQDGSGFVYLHSRIAYNDIAQFQRGHITFDELSIRFEIKLGHTNNLPRRFKEYKKCTEGYLFFWHCAYTTTSRMLLERLVHLSLIHLGARISRYRCFGCGKRHREYYSLRVVKGFVGLESLTEFWLGALGEVASQRILF
ncbi:hypothetical protein R3P38DRAFT_3175551 [Favolaschia claudopus]|uniref:Bacteriophage T5 Orf172 DNA-binding domain-containing protein n=1 Tax=Favolaschia claudopus TaxID=2862362 RepID=A0AAW0D3H0_9AGAR